MIIIPVVREGHYLASNLAGRVSTNIPKLALT